MSYFVRKFDKTDKETRKDWINNPIINTTMFFDLPMTIEKMDKWYEAIKENPNRIDFTFIDTNLNIVCAMGGYNVINRRDNNAEFYLMVSPDLIGKGIGTIVSKWLYNFGFSSLKLNKIYLYTDISNVIAENIYIKCGFKLEGTLKQHALKENVYHDLNLFGLLREDWINTSWANNEISFKFK